MAGRVFRVVELYCGIGGLAAALAPAPAPRSASTPVEVVAAIDINRVALGVYGHNFDHPTQARQVRSVSAAELARLDADLWWASPPCQPFTRRGLGRDLDDPRAATFRDLVERLGAVRPRYFAMENVRGFEGSRAHGLLLETLRQGGYADLREVCLCPSQLGMPNRRPRFYLVASRDGALGSTEPEAEAPRRPLAAFLDPVFEGEPESDRAWTRDARLAVDPDLARRYEGALHVVEAEDDRALTACFTSAYGRSPVRSGSYLGVGEGKIRRFSPTEVLRLLGFPARFELPRNLSHSSAWRLVGNSLSLPPVRRVLGAIPELAPGRDL